jgi:hypothetical protein
MVTVNNKALTPYNTGGSQVGLPASATNLTATAGLSGYTGPVQAAGAIPVVEKNPADGQTIIT